MRLPISWRPVFLLLVVGFLVFPTALVTVLSFGTDETIRFPPDLATTRWYEELLRAEDWHTAAKNSLVVGLIAAMASMVLGTPAALALARGRLPGRRVLELLFLSPMVIPPIVLAVGGYDLFVSLGLTGSLLGLAALHTILAVPFVVLLVVASLQRADPALELAAASLGATPLRRFYDVTFKLALPAVLIGGLFAFVSSFDEVVLALFVLGITGGETVPLHVISSLNFGVSPIVAAVSTMQVVMALMLAAVLYGLRSRQRTSTR
jgi:mannopine transport system permease protein